MQATQPPSGPRSLEFEDDIENPQGPQLKVTLFQQCCNELRQEDTICVCPALKHVSEEVRIQFEQEQHQGLPQIVSRIYQTVNQTLWNEHYLVRDISNAYTFNVENVRDTRKRECKERGKTWTKKPH
ncbi:unnamed protein product, partial [Brassica oleracea]